jgi:hypothetical protein
VNDIDLKMVEFYNLDAHYYTSDNDMLGQRNYFKNDPMAEQADPTIDVRTLESSAHDLLRMKRDLQKSEEEEISRDLSNVIPSDSFDEVVFKIFEQVKSYNNRLSEFNK